MDEAAVMRATLLGTLMVLVGCMSAPAPAMAGPPASVQGPTVGGGGGGGGSGASDAAFNSGTWAAATTVAPSKHAVGAELDLKANTADITAVSTGTGAPTNGTTLCLAAGDLYRDSTPTPDELWLCQTASTTPPTATGSVWTKLTAVHIAAGYPSSGTTPCSAIGEIWQNTATDPDQISICEAVSASQTDATGSSWRLLFSPGSVPITAMASTRGWSVPANALGVDGTVCTQPVMHEIVSGGPLLWAINCSTIGNAACTGPTNPYTCCTGAGTGACGSGTIYGSFKISHYAYTGTSQYPILKLIFVDTATSPSGTFNTTVSSQCRTPGTDTIDNVWSATPLTSSTNMSGAARYSLFATLPSGNLLPDPQGGSCALADFIFWKQDVTGGTTPDAASIWIIGATVRYGVTANSD